MTPALPCAEPSDNGAGEVTSYAKKNARRTLLLWIALIGFFFAIYRYLGPAPGDAAAGVEASPQPSLALFLLSAIVAIFLILVSFLFRGRLCRATTSFNRETNEGSRAMEESRFADAERRSSIVLACARCAFIATSARSQVASVRDAGLVDADLLHVRPAERGELGVVAATWPELRAFIAANGLDAAMS